VLSERRDIREPLAQRWYSDLYHAQPIVEILAELARRDQRLEVAMCRRDHAGLGAFRPVCAHRIELVLLQRSRRILSSAMPSNPGIRTSDNTTSGETFGRRLSASSALAAATTSLSEPASGPRERGTHARIVIGDEQGPSHAAQFRVAISRTHVFTGYYL